MIPLIIYSMKRQTVAKKLWHEMTIAYEVKKKNVLRPWQFDLWFFFQIWRCLSGHHNCQILYLINLTVLILATFSLQISKRLLHISKTCTMQPRDQNMTSFSLLFWFNPVGQMQKSEEICFFLQVLYFLLSITTWRQKLFSPILVINLKKPCLIFSNYYQVLGKIRTILFAVCIYLR